MRVKEATEKDINIFRSWKIIDRIEEQTCRPIINGQRQPVLNEIYTLAFFINNEIEPTGKFTYFNLNSRNRSCEFGYVINPNCRGKGLGTKMLEACIDFLFSTTNFNKLYCQTASFNKASIKLLEHIGFFREAVLREHHELDGKLFDDFIYSLLRKEWNKSDINNLNSSK